MMRLFMPGRTWRVLLVLGSLLIAVGILALLVYREREVLLNYDWNLRWQFLVGGFGLLLAGLALAALVWASMMRTLGSQVAYRDHIRYFVISHLARRLPGTVWYVASRSYLYRQHGEAATFIASASALELVITTVSGALVALVFGSLSTTLSLLQVIGLLMTLALGAVATHPTVIHWALRRLGQATAPRTPYRCIVQWCCAYVAIWVLGGAILYLVANAVTVVELRFAPYLIGSWSLVGVLSVLVFFLPSNLGFTEVGLSLLLASLMPSSVAVLIALLSRIVSIVYEILGAWLTLAIFHLFRADSKRDISPGLSD